MRTELELTQEETDLILKHRASERHKGDAFSNQQPPSPEETLDWIFTYHDDPSAYPHYVEIREAAKQFARTILRHTPRCPDSLQAIEWVRLAVMVANASVALKGRGL